MATVRTELVVNGTLVVLDVEPATRLLDVLRTELGLYGTKEACGRGECGACTVLVDGKARLACIELAVRARTVDTVEGLGDESEGFRRALADHGGFQCGFCTPGHVVRAVALMRQGVVGEGVVGEGVVGEGVADKGVADDEAALREAISGNLCRCTGYDGIIDAYRAQREGTAAW